MLLEKHLETVNAIQTAVKLNDQTTAWVSRLLQSYARFVQTLPLTPHLPDLTALDYGLRLSVAALGIAEQAADESLNTAGRYALLSAVLIRQAGAIAAGHQVSLYRQAEPVGDWQPLAGPMKRAKATHFTATFTGRAPLYSLNALLCRRLVPPKALNALCDAGDWLDEWLDTLTEPQSRTRLGRWLVQAEWELGLIPTGAAPAAVPKVHAGTAPAASAPARKWHAPPPDPPFLDPNHLGAAFLLWVRDGLQSGRIEMNTREAPVHFAPDGVVIARRLLAQYGGVESEPIERRLLKLQLHAKTPDGGDFFSYQFGEGKTWKAIRIPDVGLLFAGVPELSRKLRLVEGL